MAKQTKGDRIARERLFRHLELLDTTEPTWGALERQVPEAWHMLAHDIDVEEAKEKVTLYLDQSVARMFRAMGPGYQARINRVLATWVGMHAAGLLEFRKTFEARMARLIAEDREREARGEKGGGFGSGVGGVT